MNPRPPALALCCLLVAGVLGALVLRGEEPETPVLSAAPVAEAGAAARPLPELRALRVLRAWDARRAAAWASGDPAALVELYVAGSRARGPGGSTGRCSGGTPTAGCGSPACASRSSRWSC